MRAVIDMTEIVPFTDPRLLKAASDGRVIAFPTETVFGLGVRSDNKAAFDELVRVKRRPPEKPFTLMCASTEYVGRYAVISPSAKRVIDRFMPGPLTLLLPPRPGLDPWVTLDSPTIGVRVPALGDLCEFIAALGVPLLVPSANRSGERPARTAAEVAEMFKDEISYIAEGAVTTAKPSTIVRLDGAGISLVREGDLPFAAVKAVYEEGNQL